MSKIDDMGLYLAYERGYERGREEGHQDGYDKAVDMACAWMERHLPQCIEIENNYVVVKTSFIDDFKKAMKNESK